MKIKNLLLLGFLLTGAVMFGAELKDTDGIPSNCYYPADLELFPSEIYGNRQLNSIVTINQTNKLELTFDKKGNVKKGLMYVLDELSKTWSEYAQFGYTFDANGNLSNTICKIKVLDNDWMNYRKVEFTYNAQGQKTQEITYDWNEKWEYLNKKTYEYDNTYNYLTLITFYEYQSAMEVWQKLWSDKYERTYNAAGLAISYVSSKWSSTSSEWHNDFKEEVEYDEKGRETCYIELYWESNKWENRYRTTTAYVDTDEGTTTLAKVEEWDNKQEKWVEYKYYAYNLDKNGNEIYYSEGGFRNGQYENGLYTRTSTYDSNGHLLKVERVYKYDTGDSLTEYAYDEYGNRISKIYSVDDIIQENTRWNFSSPSGLINMFSDKENTVTRKVLNNGQILILRGDKIYNINGAVLH